MSTREFLILIVAATTIIVLGTAAVIGRTKRSERDVSRAPPIGAMGKDADFQTG
jgi:hypothetical protein